jgi:hypothetical protein
MDTSDVAAGQKIQMFSYYFLGRGPTQNSGTKGKGNVMLF